MSCFRCVQLVLLATSMLSLTTFRLIYITNTLPLSSLVRVHDQLCDYVQGLLACCNWIVCVEEFLIFFSVFLVDGYYIHLRVLLYPISYLELINIHCWHIFYDIQVSVHDVSQCKCMDYEEVVDVGPGVLLFMCLLRCILFTCGYIFFLLVLWRHIDSDVNLQGLGPMDMETWFLYLCFVIPKCIFLFCRKNTLWHAGLNLFCTGILQVSETWNWWLNKSRYAKLCYLCIYPK